MRAEGKLREQGPDLADEDMMADPIRRRTAIEGSTIVSEAARAAAATLARSPGILPPSWWSKVLAPDHGEVTQASIDKPKNPSEQSTMASAVEEPAWPIEEERKIADKEADDGLSDAVETATAALQQSGFKPADVSLCRTEFGLIFALK